MIERLGPLELAARRAFLRLHEHATTRREEHGDLAGLGNLDDALAKLHVLDALANVVPQHGRVIAHGLVQIRSDRRLLEALDRRTGRRRRRSGPRWLLTEHRRLPLLFRRSVRRLVPM